MFRLLPVTLVLIVACTSDRGGEAEQPAPAAVESTSARTSDSPESDPSQPSEPSQDAGEVEAEPVAELPDHMTGKVTISAKQSRAKGLPALGFSLDFSGTGFSVSPFVNEAYLHASGPPGGPLSIAVSPVARGAALGQVVEGDLKAQSIEIAGGKRAAAAWISGESMARTSWCAFVIEPASGDDALLFEVGVGHSGKLVACKTALDHPEVAKVLATFAFE